ncbi:MAG: hypothetical protein WBN37_08230, partial [Arenicellales bacterium]
IAFIQPILPRSANGLLIQPQLYQYPTFAENGATTEMRTNLPDAHATIFAVKSRSRWRRCRGSATINIISN